MRKLCYPALAVLLLAVASLGGCSKSAQKPDDAPHQPEPSPPNVIVILADDLGYADVGFNGCEDIPTPNIDRIAQNGVKFTDAYVSFPVCGPSRAGLITGRHQERFGFCRNPIFAPKDSTQGLPLSEETLASALRRGGYRSMAIGKWHLGAHASQRPLKRGFDEFFGFLIGGHRYFPEEWTLNDISEIRQQWDGYKTKLLRNDTRVEETEYLTDALSREAVSFVERSAESPFFLYLAYNAPHAPLQATDKYLERFSHIENEKRRVYAAMVSAMDDGVGLLLDKLEERALDQNTLVVFLSDNGGPVGGEKKSNGSDNGPLREGKSSLYEGGIRVPMAMQWPAQMPKGRTFGEPVSSLDIFATAVKRAGVEPKKPLDGVDLVPYLTGAETGRPHERLFWRKWDANGFAIRQAGRKLVDAKGDGPEIYDLSADLSETNPLVEEVQSQAELLKAYREWEAQLADPLFLGLGQMKEYNSAHPDRFDEVEPY